MHLVPALFQSEATSFAHPHRGAFIGSYDINSTLEWGMIMHMMALLLIRRLGSLARALQDTTKSAAEDGSLNRRLAMVQGRLAAVSALRQARHSLVGGDDLV